MPPTLEHIPPPAKPIAYRVPVAYRKAAPGVRPNPRTVFRLDSRLIEAGEQLEAINAVGQRAYRPCTRRRRVGPDHDAHCNTERQPQRAFAPGLASRVQ